MPVNAEELKPLKEELAKANVELGRATELLQKKEGQIVELEKRGEGLSKDLEKVTEDYKRINKEVDEITKRLQTPGLLPGSEEGDKKGAEMARKAHNKFVRSMRFQPGREGSDLTTEERALVIPGVQIEGRAISISSDVSGGFLVVPEQTSRIIDKLTQVSRIREKATVMGTQANAVEMVAVKGKPSAVWAQELATRSETTGTQFEKIKIDTHELTALLKPTHQMLEDTSFNLESWLENMMLLQFAAAEGNAFLLGNGVGKPRGLIAHPDVEVVDADATVGTASGYFNSDDVIRLSAALPSEYANPGGSMLTHRQTMATMRRFKDNQNRPLDLVERDILAKGPGFTIDGYPGMEMPDMAQPGTASGLLLAFANVQAAYTIVDRNLMVLLRDPYSSKLTGVVDLLYRRRVGGDTVLPAAVKVLRAVA